MFLVMSGDHEPDLSGKETYQRSAFEEVGGRDVFQSNYTIELNKQGPRSKVNFTRFTTA